jgi:hypothetical protein
MSAYDDCSFAPLGLGSFHFFTHALRRGLHSFAASRLEANFCAEFGKRVLTLSLLLREARFA